MSSFIVTAFHLVLVISAWSNITLARRSADLYCGACRALVDELDWEISQVDPGKVVETGSYSLGPDGNPVATMVPYARSEMFLLELLERVCEHMEEYGERVDPETHRSTYVRVLSREGTQAELLDTQFTEGIASNLKQACEKLAEEY
ncbi:protein canopy homolog 2-like, partial [Mustelus asterias]